MSRDSTATVRRYDTPWSAHIARGRLESEGIPAFLINEHHSTAYWPITQALGLVQLKVPAVVLKNATKIIDQHENGDYEEPVETGASVESSYVCYRCGEDDIARRKAYITWEMFAYLAIGLTTFVIWPLRKWRIHCGACGARY